MADLKSANMVRRDTLLIRRKVLVQEIESRTAQVAKLDARVAEVNAAIEKEATFVRAAVAAPSVLHQVVPGAVPPATGG